MQHSSVSGSDTLPMLAALDLFDLTGHLPTAYRLLHPDWHTSRIVPLRGRVILEFFNVKAPGYYHRRSSASVQPGCATKDSCSTAAGE